MTVTWNGNGNVQSVVNKNVELLTFEEAMAQFEKQISIKYSFEEDDESLQNKVLYIKKITLGYMEIQQKDSDLAILVPAWNFFGLSTNEYNEEKMESGTYSLRSMLSLNAVDVSIINS